jgi:hypothetical protein
MALTPDQKLKTLNGVVELYRIFTNLANSDTKIYPLGDDTKVLGRTPPRPTALASTPTPCIAPKVGTSPVRRCSRRWVRDE